MVRPTGVAARLGVLRLSDDEDGWPDVLTSADVQWPRLRYVQSVPRSRLKPTAEVLADAEGVGAGAVEPSALIARMRFGAGEIVFVATDEIWRWRYGQVHAAFVSRGKVARPDGHRDRVGLPSRQPVCRRSKPQVGP